MRVLVISKDNGTAAELIAFEVDESSLREFSQISAYDITQAGCLNILTFPEYSEDFIGRMSDVSNRIEGVKLIPNSREYTAYTLKMVMEAMSHTGGWNKCWWNDAEIMGILDYGKKQGWLTTISLTQIQWSEKGSEIIDLYRNEILNGLEAYFASQGEHALPLKMLEAIRNEANHCTVMAGRINRWIYNLYGNSSTVYLRDNLCEQHKELFKTELDWYNAFTSLDSSLIYALDYTKET